MRAALSTEGRTQGVVLVADGNPEARTHASNFLRDVGFIVFESESLPHAIRMFEKKNPDIVLMELAMSEPDNFEVFGLLRGLKGGEGPGILILAESDGTESINKAFEAGAADVIAKPINPVLLVQRVRSMWRSISLREELAQKSEAKNRALIQAIPDLILQIDPIGIIEDLKVPQGWDMSALPAVSIGRNIYEIFPADTLPDALNQTLQTGKMHIIECLELGETKRGYECRLIRSGENQTLAILRDTTIRKRIEEKVRMAYRDPLTGLLNRHSFKMLFDKAIEQAKRYNRLLALMFLDLDRFKFINDSLGHQAGDVLLQRVGERIMNTLRKSDSAAYLGTPKDNIVSRHGGDEFTILLTEINHAEDGLKVARRALESFSAPFIISDQEVFVSVSIGVAIYPYNGQDMDTLLKNADTAMYHAKEKGRNNVQAYSDSMGSITFRRFDLETKLRKALDRKEFMLYYQPLVHMQVGDILGSEALIRWNSPTMGIVSPAEFIPLAEEAGLIGAIGEWALIEACRQNKAWHDLGHTGLSVAVNLSSLQFKQRDIFRDVAKALEISGMDPSCLDLELTESAIMDNVESALATLMRFRSLGCKISIDDFGTGYSSLSYLKRFPIDALKIDRSFVTDILTNHDDAAIATAIIAMARSLNLQVIAEGIETRQQMDFLSSQGCDKAQGYFFSKPMDKDAMTKFLEIEEDKWKGRTIYLW